MQDARLVEAPDHSENLDHFAARVERDAGNRHDSPSTHDCILF